MFSFRHQGLLHKKLKKILEKGRLWKGISSFFHTIILINLIFVTVSRLFLPDCKIWGWIPQRYTRIWLSLPEYMTICGLLTLLFCWKWLGNLPIFINTCEAINLLIKSVLIHHPLRRGHKFPMVLTTSYPLPSQLKIEICFVFLFQITSKVVSLQRIVHRILEAQI